MVDSNRRSRKLKNAETETFLDTFFSCHFRQKLTFFFNFIQFKSPALIFYMTIFSFINYDIYRLNSFEKNSNLLFI